MPPITALQGLGITAAENIKNERKRGKFTSIEDLNREQK